MIIDKADRLLTATTLGVQVSDSEARCSQIINPPGRDRIDRIAFAGADGDWLYATAGGKLYRRKLATAGAGFP
jgi:hypothetical protein